MSSPLQLPRGALPPLRVAVLFCGLFAVQLAYAARPMVTDDARTVDDGACQLETWLQFGLGNTEYWALPACNFGGGLEVTFGGAIAREVAQKTYLTHVVLQGKILFKTLEPNSWSLGLAAGNLRRPRVHTDKSPVGDVYLYLPASFAFFGEYVVVHLNLGWQYEKELKGRGHHLRWGVGFEVQLGERSWLIAETFAEDKHRPVYQLGLRLWLVPEHVQVDATLGDRFGGKTKERWFSVGLRLISPALF